jgi:hypothetical protein
MARCMRWSTPRKSPGRRFVLLIGPAGHSGATPGIHRAKPTQRPGGSGCRWYSCRLTVRCETWSSPRLTSWIKTRYQIVFDTVRARLRLRSHPGSMGIWGLLATCVGRAFPTAATHRLRCQVLWAAQEQAATAAQEQTAPSPVRTSPPVTASVASRSTSAPGSARSHAPARFWSAPPSKTSPRAPGSSSKTPVTTNSRVSPIGGISTGCSADRPRRLTKRPRHATVPERSPRPATRGTPPPRQREQADRAMNDRHLCQWPLS